MAGDVGPIGDEEVDEVGDVLGGSGAREGDALEIFLALLFGEIFGPFDYAGGDAVDGDVGGEGAGEAAGEGGEGGFAGGVGEVFRPGAVGEEVDHVDDVAAG